MNSFVSKKYAILVTAILISFIASVLSPLEAISSCGSPQNDIEAENCLPGNLPSEWDIDGAGDSTIQGFATNISVNQGDTVSFKIDTGANSYSLDIYRMGYYGGNGARKVATVTPSASLPQNQPACLTNSTGLIDCGNWAVSASWLVPANATSGIYFAKAIRTDTGGATHIFFIVRNDASHSDILFQASDTTWQAYNDYGGNSLYLGNGEVGRAYKVSFNRPFQTRVFENESWVFNAEYPMVRWLEANGYDVTYFTDTDSDRNGALIQNHKVWMSNGHDEYWSANQRANVEAARDAGTHLAFFSSNTMFWKTRWEASIDGSATPYRTLVCYKETHDNAKTDPAGPTMWTGTWRDPRFSPPADGGRPENALLGSIFMINGSFTDDITVPQTDGLMRFWRNTSVALLVSGATATLAPGTLGAEVDVDLDNGFRPAGLFGLSTNVINTDSLYLLDYGSNYGPGSATHKLTLYRHANGALVFSSGTYQWSWGLDANHDRSNLGSTTDVRMKQATVNLFADMGVQPTTLQIEAGLALATASSDSTAPTSAISSPLSGATVTPGMVTPITGTASDTGGGVVGGVEVSTDNGVTWHPAAGRESWGYSWTPISSGTVTILSRAVDDSGNIETPSGGVSVTVSGVVACTENCTTIWSAGTIPATVDSDDPLPYELGVKFKTDVDGWITGVRFYKAGTNTGTHIGNLWNSAGNNLATATFANETSSGWQQVSFFTPVAVTAGTVYVASYHTNAGHYSYNSGYFATQTNSPPLHALADSDIASPGNGVYASSSTSIFPNHDFNQTNYWVDVVFSPTEPPAATLSSIAVTPSGQTIQIGSTKQFTAIGTYSNGSTKNITTAVDWLSSNTGAATINSAGLATAVGPGNTTISATDSGSGKIGSTNLIVQADPLAITTASLHNGIVNVPYSVVLAASGGTVPYTWSKTGSLPTGLSLDPGTGIISGTPTVTGTFNFTVRIADVGDPIQIVTRSLSITIGPKGPILIISSASNPFSSYYTEILRTEGLSEFNEIDISYVTSGVLASFDVVILGEISLTSDQATMFEDWVNSGGHLIAMRPDSKLAGLLGLTLATGPSSTIANAYLLVNTSTGPGVGIVNETIQYHGDADLYSSSATTVATLYSDALTTTTYPAVTLNNVGSNGGKAAAFTYDLARSVVYTRQGNPAWAGDKRDGLGAIRPDDLFYGAKAGDVKPDWVDLNKVAIPQADEQQRLLANLVIQMNSNNKPLPRFWYFPRNLSAVVVMTGDSHGTNGISGRFDNYIANSPSDCSVANWECIRSTSYLYTESTPDFSNADAVYYDALGFEVGLHINTSGDNWTPSELEEYFTDQLSVWSSKYTSLQSPVSNRTHAVTWSDYATTPAVELNHGIRLDTTYYYYPPAWVNDRPGFFTGSGMPMRFTNSNGNLIDVYQAVTQMTDESGQTYPYTINTLLDRAKGTQGYYGVFTTNFHMDDVASIASDDVVNSATNRGIPVVSSKQMLTWLDGRNASTFSSLVMSGSTFSFSISVGAGATGLVTMVPIPDGKTVSSMTRDGSPFAQYDLTRIKGIQYARFNATNGNYAAELQTGDEQEVLSASVDPLTVVYGSTAALGAAGGSGTGAVTFGVGTSTGCSILGSTLLVTNASGTCLVTAIKAADATYNEATSAPVAVTLQKADQTVTLNALAPKNNGDADFTLGATASSGLSVSYSSSDTSVATMSTNTVHILSAGTTTITAMQVGDSNYNPASGVQRLLTVYPAFTGATLEPSVSSPQLAGIPIQFTAGGAGGSGNYEYQFWISNGGPWSVVQDYSTTNTWDWVTTGLAQGTYNITVRVRNVGSLAELEASMNVGYNILTSLPATGVTLEPSVSSPQEVGTTIQFTAGGVGGSLSYEYEFWLYSGGTWTVVQDYSTTNTWPWVTTGLTQGTYNITVRVRNAGSLAALEASTNVGYNLVTSLPATGATLTPGVASPQAIGTTITFTAGGVGGSGSYEYQFWLYSGGTWTVVQEYSADNTWPWVTTGLTQGTYNITVRVRNAGSLAALEASTNVGYNLVTSLPATGVTLEPSVSSPQAVGTPIQFTAGGVGGSGNYEYEFWLYSGGTWTVVQAYSTTNTWPWVTTGLAQGTYNITVRVRNAGSLAALEASTNVGYNLVTSLPATGATLTPGVASPQAIGTPIQFTAGGVGGSGNYEYEFWLYSGGTWTVVQAYSTTNTWPWVTTGLAQGTYNITVRVRNAGSLAALEASTNVGYNLVTSLPATGVTLEPSVSSPQAIGTPITFTAGGVGGSGNYEYEFWLYSGGTWTVVQAYSATNTWPWVTTGLTQGTYNITVRVRNAGSLAALEASTNVGYNLVTSLPATGVTLEPSVSSPQAIGAPIQFTAGGVGGSGSYEYQFWLYSGGTWTVVQEYSADNTWDWVTTDLTEATYNITVRVRNAGSLAALEASTNVGYYIFL